MEAHAIRGKDLYIALKWPMEPERNAHILRIPNFKPVFTKGDEIHVKLERWKSIPLGRLEGEKQYVSDMLFLGDTLYFTSSCWGKECGGLWKLASGAADPELLATFPEGKAEGLAFNSDAGSFLVTFDRAEKGSRVVHVPLAK